jgi:hypothetical protein
VLTDLGQGVYAVPELNAPPLLLANLSRVVPRVLGRRGTEMQLEDLVLAITDGLPDHLPVVLCGGVGAAIMAPVQISIPGCKLN